MGPGTPKRCSICVSVARCCVASARPCAARRSNAASLRYSAGVCTNSACAGCRSGRPGITRSGSVRSGSSPRVAASKVARETPDCWAAGHSVSTHLVKAGSAAAAGALATISIRRAATNRKAPSCLAALARELLVLDPVRHAGIDAEPPCLVSLIVLKVTLEPFDVALALEGEHVRRDAVEEPAIVADDHSAAGEILQRLLQRAQRIDVEIVGRLVEQQHVGTGLEHLGKMHAVALAARERADFLLLVGALEVECRDDTWKFTSRLPNSSRT